MLDIKSIVDGTIKNILNINEELYKNRIAICKTCKLLKSDAIFGEVCNSSLYLNPYTDETSSVPKKGFKNGCGCVLRSKCRVIDAECPLKKW